MKRDPRRQLEAARAELQARLSRLAVPVAVEAHAGYSDFVDGAHAIEQTDTATRDVAVVTAQLVRIERALEHVDRGLYGVCEDCARPIAAARLRVLPEATRCVRCQDHLERRPAE